MIDATGNPQSILVLGGTSDIGLAVCAAYLARQPAKIVLASRPGTRTDDAVADLVNRGATDVQTIDFDALDFASHPAVLDEAFAQGDIDVAIVAFGLLGDAEQLWQDQAKAVELAQLNYTGAVSVGVLLGQRMTAQGHGKIVALSSVAGEKVRRSNFVYGSSKAGVDAFYRNLGQALAPAGVGAGLAFLAGAGLAAGFFTKALAGAAFFTGFLAAGAGFLAGAGFFLLSAFLAGAGLAFLETTAFFVLGAAGLALPWAAFFLVGLVLLTV